MMEVNDSNWEREVIKSEVPVIVDFWAEWCGPCKMMIPVLNAVSEKLHDKIKIVSVNIENEMDLAKSNSIRSVPTFSIFVNGKSEDKIVGMTSLANILKLMDKYVI